MIRVRRAVPFAARLVAATAISIGLVGCTAGTEEQDSSAPSTAESVEETASPTPSVDPTQALIDERAVAAEKRYRELLKITSEHTQRGESPFWELNDNFYITGTYREDAKSLWDYFVSEGRSHEGHAEIKSITMTSHEGDTSKPDVIQGHAITFDVCTDRTGLTILDKSGQPMDSGPASVRAEITMQGKEGETWAAQDVESLGSGC